MCGRFSLTGDLDFYAEYFGVDEVVTGVLSSNWNVAPTDPVYVVSEGERHRRLQTMNWGLVSYWSDDHRTIHINARVETVATTPAFRDSFARNRCLVPADGFYEWETPEHGRAPHWVYRADGFPMAFAGIWASRQDHQTGEWQRTCSIITTQSTGVLAGISERMPVTLSPEVWRPWLDRDLTDADEALSLVQMTDPAEIMDHIVSRRVNNVASNSPDLQVRIESETLF